MKLVHAMLIAAFFLASCDIFLTVNVGGNLRASQVLMIGVCLGAAGFAIQQGRILWPRGASALTLWCFVQLMFIPVADELKFALASFAMLVFTVLGVLSVTQLYGLSPRVEWLMRGYVGSYLFAAVFGMVQFTLPLLGLPSPLVMQWIKHGRIARINGFNIEPSYFATYLLVGWIMMVDLRRGDARITRSAFWKWGTILTGVALFLSTSKTAWVFMLVELLARVAPPIFRWLRQALNGLRVQRVLLPLPSPRLVPYIVVIGGGLSALALFVATQVDPTIFLQGTGLGGTAAHSVVGRLTPFHESLAGFLEQPWVGHSLGGVPVYLAGRHGIPITTFDRFRLFWAFPVLLEVLLASGLVGFIPFAIFVYRTTIGALRFAHRRLPDERAKWLRALARALIFEWLVLLVDQNLLRVYLWFHIAMVMAVAYHLEFAPAPEPMPEKPRRWPILLYEAPSAP